MVLIVNKMVLIEEFFSLSGEYVKVLLTVTECKHVDILVCWLSQKGYKKIYGLNFGGILVKRFSSL